MAATENTTERKYKLWNACVRAARDAGLDFDERDIESMDIDKQSERPDYKTYLAYIQSGRLRFLDHTDTETFSMDIITSVIRQFKDKPEYIRPLIVMYLNRFFGLNLLCPSTSYVYKNIVEGKAVLQKKGHTFIDNLTQRMRIPVVCEYTGKMKQLKISTAYIQCVHRLEVHADHITRQGVPLREYIQEARTLII